MEDRNGERGSALAVSLAMLVALGISAAALVLTTAGDLQSAGRDRRGVRAQMAAEAGMQEAIHRLSLAAGTMVTTNGTTFDASVRDASTPLDPDWLVRVYDPGETPPMAAGPSQSYTPSVQNSSGALDYTRVGNYLTIQHKWVDRNTDGVRDADEIVRYDANLMPPENFDSGSPIEVVEIEGRAADARRRIRVEATRFPFTPNLLAALGSDRGIDAGGSARICGNNHDVTTPTGTHLGTTPACSPDYDEASGHLRAIATSGDPVLVGDSTDLLGFPAAIDTSSSNPFYTLAQSLGVAPQVADRLLDDPDHLSATEGGPFDGVTFVDGDATGSEAFDSVDGQGLLYVTGDLELAGSFVWRGLVYVEGDLVITGSPWVLGAVMVRGESTYGVAGGSPAILYSREAILTSLQPAFAYMILSWKEL